MNYSNMGSGGRDHGTPMPLMPQPSSVYSLTFDEFQNTMGSFGKDFGSMNMDEFLKSIWTAEESQAIVGPAIDGGPGGRQGSLTLPRTLSLKTVDDVWRDLAEVPCGGGLGFQKQPTLGEMTLEEFLVKSGVVREVLNQSPPQPITNIGNADDSLFHGEPSNPNGNLGLALEFSQPGRCDGTIVPNPIPNNSSALKATSTRPYVPPLPTSNGSDMANSRGVRGGGLMRTGVTTLNNDSMGGVVGGRVTVSTVGSPANQIASDGFTKGNGELSSLSPVPYVFNGGARGRKCSGAVERVVERRQRRMIKNRESAARSRARKQAYTMELEAEVAKLKEQNHELHKKEVVIMEMQKNKVVENQQRGPKRRCLRRTQTGPL